MARWKCVSVVLVPHLGGRRGKGGFATRSASTVITFLPHDDTPSLTRRLVPLRFVWSASLRQVCRGLEAASSPFIRNGARIGAGSYAQAVRCSGRMIGSPGPYRQSIAPPNDDYLEAKGPSFSYVIRWVVYYVRRHSSSSTVPKKVRIKKKFKSRLSGEVGLVSSGQVSYCVTYHATYRSPGTSSKRASSFR